MTVGHRAPVPDATRTMPNLTPLFRTPTSRGGDLAWGTVGEAAGSVLSSSDPAPPLRLSQCSPVSFASTLLAPFWAPASWLCR